jgi:hypothetical protein
MMHTKLAGHIPLHEMIANTINGARNKLAAEGAEAKEEAKKVLPFMKKKEEKDEKKEGKEKESSAFDFSDPDELLKLASALDELGDKLADSKYVGGEKSQGGEVLPTASAVPGKQPYKKDSSKSHNIPASTPEKSTSDNPGASTATETDDKPGKLLKYLRAKYPDKGVLKTAALPIDLPSLAAEGVGGLVGHHYGKKQKERGEEYTFGVPQGAAALFLPGGLGYQVGRAIAHETHKTHKKGEKEKKSSALEYILGKVATFGAQEKKMGGETLDSASEQGPKPPSDSKGGNDARSHIRSNKAAIDMKKVEGKNPQKRMLSEVLTEPAQSKAHDSKVHENLRNASKGGVKIAAAKAFLRKIAADECHPQHEKLKEALKKRLEKKSMGGLGMGAPMPTTPPAPMPMAR